MLAVILFGGPGEIITAHFPAFIRARQYMKD